MVRFHMPGHKGNGIFGFEKYDITEVKGADSLYEADGIIAESEKNAGALFGSARTVYSTEGSSQCIRAMLYLAACESRKKQSECRRDGGPGGTNGGRPLFIAARNVHKAFVYGAALIDADVRWLYDEGGDASLCACRIKADTLEKILEEEERTPAAVYITSPDYLGNMNDIAALAQVCHRHGTILAVDNAHGAYLHFLKKPMHPLDLGADICCDSAHKTLPVITGGAYLHISRNAPESFGKNAKQAMALFGSTSPSYLIIASLDMCNRYLAEKASDEYEECAVGTARVKAELKENGWTVKDDTDPLKLTICATEGCTGKDIESKLRAGNIECEYADPEYTVLMISPGNSGADMERVAEVLGKGCAATGDIQSPKIPEMHLDQGMSIREAVFAPSEMIDTDKSAGRICASPAVSCPPAVPIAVSGEMIDEKAVAVLKHYGIKKVSCVIPEGGPRHE